MENFKSQSKIEQNTSPNLAYFPLSEISSKLREREIVSTKNIQIVFGENRLQKTNIKSDFFQNLREEFSQINLTLFSPEYFTYAVAYLSQKDPSILNNFSTQGSSKSYFRIGKNQVKNLASQIKIFTKNKQIFLREKGNQVNLSETIDSSILDTQFNLISKNLTLIDAANHYTSTLLKQEKNIAVLIRSRSLDPDCFTVAVSDEAHKVSSGFMKYADYSIPTLNITDLNQQKENYYQALERRQNIVSESQNIIIGKAFTARSMPTHHLFDDLKLRVKNKVIEYLENENILADPLDLTYQIIFRLTAYESQEIYPNLPFNTDAQSNSTLDDYGIVTGQINQINWAKLDLNTNLIFSLLQEQLVLMRYRFGKNNLDYEKILSRHGIFGEEGWVIGKIGGKILAFNKEKRNEIKEIEFKEIDPSLATKFHSALHYIHAPRVSKSFGLFLKGATLPFTVLGIERVDRDYKKDGLLMFGYDPDKYLDFTRLYSWPGVPKNASSIIFKEAKENLLCQTPELQGAISTFMPTYANGSSMLAGGFEDSFLIKRNTHKFAERTIDGVSVFEHLTNRRSRQETNILENKQILLPVVELIAPFKKTHFNPLIKKGEEMIVKNS